MDSLTAAIGAAAIITGCVLIDLSVLAATGVALIILGALFILANAFI